MIIIIMTMAMTMTRIIIGANKVLMISLYEDEVGQISVCKVSMHVHLRKCI